MPSEEHEPPKPMPQALACPPGRNSTARPHPAGPGPRGAGAQPPLRGRFRISRGTGARQGPLPWLAPPEGGAAGPRAQLSWRPRSPCKGWGAREDLRGTKP